MPLRPSSSASRNAACDVPNADTMPMPDTRTDCRTRRTLPSRNEASKPRHGAVRDAPPSRLRFCSRLHRRLRATKDAAPRVRPQDSFDELYMRGKNANAAMKTLTARFTETTTSSLLTKPLVARGRVAVERPTRVVLRYTDPDFHVVLIDGDKMTMAWPGHNVRQTTDIGTAQGRVQKYFIDGTADDLRRQFDIEDHGTSDRDRASDRPGSRRSSPARIRDSRGPSAPAAECSSRTPAM